MSDHDADLHRIAAGVRRAGMRAPMAFLLDSLSPLDVIGSELARFSLPFVGGTRAAPLATALSDPAAWPALRRLLDELPPGESVDKA